MSVPLDKTAYLKERLILASSSGLFICVGVEKWSGIDCNAHVRNLHINCYSLIHKIT